MSKDEFKYMLTERFELFASAPEGKESFANADADTPQETFKIIFDDFSYWLGQTYGI